jgi:hypothetical protein
VGTLNAGSSEDGDLLGRIQQVGSCLKANIGRSDCRRQCTNFFMLDMLPGDGAIATEGIDEPIEGITRKSIDSLDRTILEDANHEICDVLHFSRKIFGRIMTQQRVANTSQGRLSQINI